MEQINKDINSQITKHFTLGEMINTKYATPRHNMPSVEQYNNLERVCQWLELLRCRYNERFILPEGVEYGDQPELEAPIIINSGYRCPRVNKLAGGAIASNHLFGCAADIRCNGPEDGVRIAEILMEVSSQLRQPYDELFVERHNTHYWVHLAVRPNNNRSHFGFIMK